MEIDKLEIQDYVSDMTKIQVCAELFKRGNFSFIVEGEDEDGNKVVHEKQRTALEILTSGKYEEFLYGGAAGGAKSWTGNTWIMFMCICYPGIRCFIARNELSDIVDSVLVTFKKVAKEYGFTDFKFNAQKHFVEFGNGSHINFIEIKYKPSDKMFEDVGSTEYTIGWIEEVGEIHPTGATVIGSRVGRFMNDKYKIPEMVFYTGNPKKNWTKTQFYDKDKNGTLESYKKYLSCLVTENPFIEKAYIKKLKRLADKDKSLYERLFKGNWDYEDNPNMLCEYEMIESIWDNDHIPEGRAYLTADIARYGSDKAVIMAWRGWKVVEMITYDISKTTDIENAIMLLRRKHRIPKNRCIADSDGVGCLEENMEVLTIGGWKKAVDITKNDKLISKSKNGFIEYHKPFEIIHHEREKFIRINDDLAFTTTHIHFYKTRRENKIKNIYWDDLVEYKNFYNDIDVIQNAPQYSNIIFDRTKKKQPHGGFQVFNNEINISLKLFCKFLGWALSDGSLDNYNNKNIIRISQSANSPHNKEIKDILNEMGVKWRKGTFNNGRLYHYSFQHKNLFEWMKDNCYIGDKYNFETKRLPYILKRTSKDNFLEFCKCFVNGDGYYHKGMMQFTGTNKVLLDEIQVGLFLNGVASRIYISHKKGSEGVIEGRIFKRTKDCYLLSEIKHPSRYIINKTETFFGRAINIRIPNETRAMLVRKGKHIFWTHNGGVVDGSGILGFANNGRPIKQKGKDENYQNIKTQCMYLLADKINEGGLWIDLELSTERKEIIMKELDQIQSANKNDRKLSVKAKDDIKADIDHSPDYLDTLMLRVFFDLKPIKRMGLGSVPRRGV